MNEQTEYWAGQAGNEYTERHKITDAMITRQRKFFERIITPTMAKEITSVMELGCNRCANLAAIQAILGFNTPERSLLFRGLEINSEAVKNAQALGWNVQLASVLEYVPGPEEVFDLVLTKGILIHIRPTSLPRVYSNIYRMAKRYIILAEYYAPKVEMIEYHGEKNRLWRGPHAEHMLQTYSDLHLVNYGFVSKLDQYPQDDITWWLLEKRNAFDKQG